MDSTAGRSDVEAAIARLADRLPEPFHPLARIAFDFAWTWAPDGRALLHDLAPERFHQSGGNAVRFVEFLSASDLDRIGRRADLLERLDALDRWLAENRRPRDDGGLSARLRSQLPGPVAFFCAEFGVHASLPVYSGGLGVLAGDLLKEASDLDLPMVGVGLLYRRGYFQQRLDLTGWQHEWWEVFDPEHGALARVTVDGVRPLRVELSLFDRVVSCDVWRADVGRIPLFLLDTQCNDNHPIDRWITSRLYESNRLLRLAQYAVLGVAGVRAVRALGLAPTTFHLNEGHPALAALELAREQVAAGTDPALALEAARSLVAFTTHTPVPAGNETYGRDEIETAYGNLLPDLGIDVDRFLELGHAAQQPEGDVGLIPLALRLSRGANAVSVRHGEVARALWQPLYPGASADDVPIGSVTNGVHLPSFMAPPMQRLLDEWLGGDWRSRVTDPGVWRVVDEIPALDLWRVRQELRAGLVERVRRHSIRDRLQRGEDLDYVAAAARTFDDDTLTVGFARRLATYKRPHLLGRDPGRALALLSPPNPIQLLLAGKAHPADEQAKAVMQQLFTLKADERVGRRVVVLENYDLRMAPWLTAGCDVWVNLPRPPNEACGTSGMKAMMNGGLNLSVLDGWWAEAYDGTNGWAIEGAEVLDEEEQDDRHAARLYDLLEGDVVSRFHDRDDDGIPQVWVDMIRASLRTLVPRFCATRMLTDYVEQVYRR